VHYLGPCIYIAERDAGRAMRVSEKESIVQIIRSSPTDAVVLTSRRRAARMKLPFDL